MNTKPTQDYFTKSSRIAIWMLVAQLPVFAYVGWHFETGIGLALGLGITILAGPLVLSFMAPNSKALGVAIGIASLSFSGLLIHLGKGMIEMHFHVFMMLACLIGLANIWAILAGTVTIAVHHIAFFFLFPESVFNYEATFGIVLLHAAFVIAETIPAVIVADKFRRFISAQSVISLHLNEIASSMQKQTSLVNGSSQQLAEGASQQAASIEETSASLEELSSVTQATVEHAQNAKNMAGTARGIVEKGASEVTAMNTAMQDIKDSSNSIAEIIKSIDEIAFQTNILALNAAVEAARAGEAGAGFAVVADEVRNLAQRSAVAARETAEKIEDSVNRSERGAQISSRVSEQLDEIFKITCQVDDLIARIAEASSEQSTGINQINTAVMEIDRVTQNSASISQENANHSGELDNLASRLNAVIGEIEGILGRDSTHQSSSTSSQSPVTSSDWNTPQREAATAIPAESEDADELAWN